MAQTKPRPYRGKYPRRINMISYIRESGWCIRLNDGEILRPDARHVVQAFPVHGLTGMLGKEWADIEAALVQAHTAALSATAAQSAANALPHVTEADKLAVLATVQAILSAGYQVRIFDDYSGDGECVYGPGTDEALAISTMGTTEGDLVQVWADGVRVGMFALIYGMTDAAETVADYSWRRVADEDRNRATMDRLHGHIMARLGGEA